jgi:hypothetical protein
MLSVRPLGDVVKILRSCSTTLMNVPRVLSLLVLVSGLSAQVGEHQPRFGFPQDWSHHHIVFNRRVMSEHPELANTEPRMLHQFLREMRRSSLPNTAAAVVVETSAGAKRDWSVALVGGRVANGMSPAVFVFDDSAPPNCANDYAVFGINVAGVTGGQANLIGFNNLYSGPGGICGAGGPSVLFAYNTTLFGGKIMTSPVLSLDGKKIAFVESAATSSIFHVITWKAGDGTSPTTSVAPGAKMTSLVFDGGASDSISSPWVDYKNDVAYVGANDGLLYKIINVFTGTPTLAGAPWPITIGAGGIGKILRLTAPVLDQSTLNLFVGDNRGFLWSVNTVTPATVKSLAVGMFTKLNPSIIDAPIVDPTNGTVIATSSNDGTSAVVVQADTTSLAQLARARIGHGSLGAVAITLYDGTFSNDYFNDPSTGLLLVCGTGAADATPWRYTFPFVGRVLQTAATSATQILNSTTSRCSPISEIFNPNIGVAPGTDLFFWGMSQDCTGVGVAGGCVMSLTNFGVVTTAKEPGGTSAIVTDNFSPLGQASSIYFSDAGSPRVAVKLTQQGLN